MIIGPSLARNKRPHVSKLRNPPLPLHIKECAPPPPRHKTVVAFAHQDSCMELVVLIPIRGKQP